MAIITNTKNNYAVMQLSAAAACYIASAQDKWVFENTHTAQEHNHRNPELTLKP